MFVVRADKPYAKPGEMVTLEALTTDARKDRPRAAKIYWIPILCLNPRDGPLLPVLRAARRRRTQCRHHAADSDRRVRGCRRRRSRGRGDGGAAAGGAFAGGNPFGNIPTGVDLGPFLPQGPTFSFRMPDNAIKQRPGSPPYGLAIIFNVSVRRPLEFAPRDPNGGAQQVPVLCTDENGVKLPPSDYVIGISRVYSYPDRTNTNPVIQAHDARGPGRPRSAGRDADEVHRRPREGLQGEQARDPRVGLELGAQPLRRDAHRRAARADLGRLVLGHRQLRRRSAAPVRYAGRAHLRQRRHLPRAEGHGRRHALGRGPRQSRRRLVDRGARCTSGDGPGERRPFAACSRGSPLAACRRFASHS